MNTLFLIAAHFLGGFLMFLTYAVPSEDSGENIMRSVLFGAGLALVLL